MCEWLQVPKKRSFSALDQFLCPSSITLTSCSLLRSTYLPIGSFSLVGGTGCLSCQVTSITFHVNHSNLLTPKSRTWCKKIPTTWVEGGRVDAPSIVDQDVMASWCEIVFRHIYVVSYAGNPSTLITRLSRDNFEVSAMPNIYMQLPRYPLNITKYLGA